MKIITPPIQNMTDAFSVKGKNVIVTGGNRGIGLGVARAFAQSGANVVILCRNKESGDKAAEEMRSYGVRSTCIQCDISKVESIRAAKAEVFKFYDTLDVLVNNAGVATNKFFLEDEDMSEWYRVLNTDLNGVATTIHEFAPAMRDAGKGGSIINISSIGGQFIGNAADHPNPPYFTAKAAVDHFTRYLAIEFGSYGIRVNVVAPGPTHSDLDADLPQAFLDHVSNDMPMHRFGEGIEIGAYCVFLASPAAAHVTGTICNCDGGLVCVGT